MEGKDRGQKVEASKGERKNVKERGEGEGERIEGRGKGKVEWWKQRQMAKRKEERWGPKAEMKKAKAGGGR